MSNEARKTPNCLNCGFNFSESLANNYCPQCGQTNNRRNISLRFLIRDFFSSYFSLEGKTWKTLLYLLFYPGYMAKLFSEGKINRFLPPIRLYFVSSLVYFTIFSFIIDDNANLFSLERDFFKLNLNTTEDIEEDSLAVIKKKIGQAIINDHELHLYDLKDSSTVISIYRCSNIAKIYGIDAAMDSLVLYKHTSREEKIEYFSLKQVVKILSDGGSKYINTILSLLPLSILVIVPLIALLLKLFYIRRNHFFVEHMVFTLHFHSFLYILLVFFLIFVQLNILKYLIVIISIIVIYIGIALKTMYQQGIFKTLLKLLLLCSTYPLFLGLMMILVFVSSFIYL